MKTLARISALFGLLSLLGGFASPALASPSQGPSEPPVGAAAQRIEWWLDAKFGLFIHWGPVSVAGTEIGWSRAGARRGFWGSKGTEVPTERYDTLYKEFDPVHFDPATWAAIAKAAGMKYIVLVTRHHDGFSLWDTQAGDYKITSPHSPYGKDIVRQLADATRAAGLRFGIYYSQPDWHHPDAFTDRHANYLAYLQQQMRELMTHYGQVDIVWFDGLGKKEEEYGSAALNKIIRELQPQALINNRNASHEDFDTPEQRVGTMEVKRPWETCMTIGRGWSWRPNEKVKSADECIRILVSTVTGGGNLLLNVGPMPDGRIEPSQVARLTEIGAWTAKNGIALYHTRGGPWANGSWGSSTYRDRTIYVHLLQPPLNGRLRLAALPHQITAARLLHHDTPIAFSQTDTAVTLDLGAHTYQGPVTIVELTTAEPVAPYQVLGAGRGAFDDESAFGTARQATAVITPSSGAITKNDDQSLTAKTDAAQAVCSPSRAALLTGLNPARLHITDWIPGRPNAASQRVLQAEMAVHVPLSVRMMPRYFREAGYHTGFFGKWHVGESPGPAEHGFEVVYHPGDSKNTTPSETEGGKAEYELTREVMRFIQADRSRPFLAYLAHYTPHAKFTAKRGLIEKNAGAFEPVYAALIETLDDSVGLLLDELERLGLADNTIVVFTSDNGGLHVPEGGHERITHNTPFRAGKGFTYEGGSRIPLVVRWPGRVPAGRVVDAPVNNVDWLPTLLFLASIEVPPGLDGVGFAEGLAGGDFPSRPLFWHYPHYTNQGGRPSGVMREDNWLLVEFYDEDKTELYDLASDIGQRHDPAAREPARVATMKAALNAWRLANHAQANSPNPAFREDEYRKVYVDVDPSTFDPVAATEGDWAPAVMAWRDEPPRALEAPERKRRQTRVRARSSALTARQP